MNQRIVAGVEVEPPDDSCGYFPPIQKADARAQAHPGRGRKAREDTAQV